MTQAIPRLGLGTYGRTGEAGTAAMLKAIEIGYRHLDTAQSYDTERQVGEAVRRSGLPRVEVFVTTKVADTHLDKAQFMDCRLDDIAVPIAPAVATARGNGGRSCFYQATQGRRRRRGRSCKG